ncbi:MAG TPA: SLC13 family permease [Thermoplasmata archaeon]|nr:SLC13 family permease [Thermoplasmata archaeon]
MNPFAALLLGGVYAAVLVYQLTRRGLPVWGIFVLGAAASVALGVLPPRDALGALASNAPVLLFLFSLFVLAADLERAGALEHLADWFLSKAREPGDIPLLLFVGFGVVSAFLVNDALVLLGVPLLFAMAKRLRVPERPLLLTLAFSVTVGSVLTPLGNPQNLLVSLSSGLRAPTAVFLRYLLVPTAINLGIGAVLLRGWFGPAMAPAAPLLPAERANGPALFPRGGWGPRLRAHPSLGIFPGTVLVLVTLDVLATVTGGPSVPSVDLGLVGAGLVLLLSPSPVRLLRRINWRVLALFAGLFVVVAGAVQGGVIAAVEGYLPLPNANAPSGASVPGVVLTALVGSQLVSNVPWTALQVPVLHGLGYGASTPLVWVGLAAGATLAGNLTLLGAASNLIVAEEADRRGTRIDLREFARYGIPLTAITVAVLVVCLTLGL